MKPLLRFLIALCFTPVALLWLLADWLYNADTLEWWRRDIRFGKK